MMNRLLRVILALSLPVIAIVALVISNNRVNPGPSYASAVAAYAMYQRSTMSRPLTITHYTEARLPQNFQASMSKASFGDAVYYRTTNRYYGTDESSWVGVGMPTKTPTFATSYVYHSSMPIPYPPNDLWCVQLNSPDPAVPKAILVALHQDIYNAEWIVHEVTDPATVLSAVGCKFASQ
jgi:hypothetical protein